MKSKAVLFGPFIGEMYWEFGRFVPHFVWQRNKYPKDTVFIVATRPDRYDMYGQHADVFSPVHIEGEPENNRQDCWGIKNFKPYKVMIRDFRNKFKDRFEIQDHIYPDLERAKLCNRNMFRQDQMIYDYRPSKECKKLVKAFLPKNNKKNVVIAPRFRFGYKRNWVHWPALYNMIQGSQELLSKFNFILVGKTPDYVKDAQGRFLDVSDIVLTEDTSLIGVTMEIIKRSCFTVGSQSAIPNMSLLYRVPVLSWGNQKKLHTKTYNVTKTPIDFIEDMKFNVKPDIVFDRLYKTLRYMK